MAVLPPGVSSANFAAACNYAGNNEQVRLDALKFAKRTGVLDQCAALVDQCLADYDLDGWRTETWR